MSKETVEIEGHVVELSRQDKVLFPDVGLTKGDLVAYYRRIGPTMLPYLRDRPLSLHRFPDGIERGGFYQKQAPEYFPSWIRRVPVPVLEEGGEQPQVVCDDTATLVYLANQACITPHTWLSRTESLDHPDKLIFDLDPPGDDFELVRAAALDLHALLDQLQVTSFLMTTGSRGLHVVIPLDGRADFDAARSLAHDVAGLLAERQPARYTVETRKEDRNGRLFLDYLRNSYAQTAVPPYAVRARPGAPVATPLDWQELRNPDLRSDSFTVANIFRRLGKKEETWQDFRRQAANVEQARSRLDRLRVQT